MNWERVTDYFVNFILSLNIDGITQNNIVTPNRLISSTGQRLWFEISVGYIDSVIVTEDTVLYPAEVNLIVCVPANTGTKRANDIASLIQSRFSGSDTEKITGFTVTGRNQETIKIYVDKAVQKPGITMNEWYKVNTRISIDVYKEK